MLNNLVNNQNIFLELLSWILIVLSFVFLFFFAFYLIFLFLGITNAYFIHRKKLLEDVYQPEHFVTLPNITFIVPTFNKGKNIKPVIDNLLHLESIRKDIIVVNDGSTDCTLDVLINDYKCVEIPKFYKEHLDTKHIKKLYCSTKFKNLYVLDKENGKKFDAINAGINALENPVFVVVDSDTVIDEDAFKRLIRPIFDDPKMVAIGTTIRLRNECILRNNKIHVGNSPRSWLVGIQNLEYVRSFLLRLGLDLIGGNPIIAGACSIFNRDVILELGGFYDTVGEDMEITLRLHRFNKEKKRKYKIFYTPDTIAWTTGPNKIGELLKQRERWHYGTCETLWFHKKLFLNFKYGLFGLFIFPFFVFAEALEPLFEVLGLFMVISATFIGKVDFEWILTLFAVIAVGYFLFSLASLTNEDLGFRKHNNSKSILRLTKYALLELVGYRLLLLIGLLKGLFTFFFYLKNVNKKSKDIKLKLEQAMQQSNVIVPEVHEE